MKGDISIVDLELFLCNNMNRSLIELYQLHALKLCALVFVKDCKDDIGFILNAELLVTSPYCS